jgi:hypothetical protein
MDSSAEPGRRRKNAFAGVLRFDLRRSIPDRPSEYFPLRTTDDGMSPRTRDVMSARGNCRCVVARCPMVITRKGAPILACSAIATRRVRGNSHVGRVRKCATRWRMRRAIWRRTGPRRHASKTSVHPSPADRMTGGYCALRENFDLVYADATPHHVPGSSP